MSVRGRLFIDDLSQAGDGAVHPYGGHGDLVGGDGAVLDADGAFDASGCAGDRFGANIQAHRFQRMSGPRQAILVTLGMGGLHGGGRFRRVTAIKPDNPPDEIATAIVQPLDQRTDHSLVEQVTVGFRQDRCGRIRHVSRARQGGGAQIFRQVCAQNGRHIVQGEGLVQHIIHAGFLPRLRRMTDDMGSQRDDRQVRLHLLHPPQFFPSPMTRRLKTVHDRHGTIHQHQIESVRLHLFQCVGAIDRHGGGNTKTGQCLDGDFAIDLAVIDHQHPRLRIGSIDAFGIGIGVVQHEVTTITQALDQCVDIAVAQRARQYGSGAAITDPLFGVLIFRICQQDQNFRPHTGIEMFAGSRVRQNQPRLVRPEADIRLFKTLGKNFALDLATNKIIDDWTYQIVDHRRRAQRRIVLRRHPNMELRAFSLFTGDGDGAPHGLDQPLGNAQAKPRAAETPRRRLVFLGEGGEDGAQLVTRDADTGIPDDQPPEAGLLVRFDRDQHMAFFSEFQRIGYEIGYHLPQSDRIGWHETRRLRMGRGQQFEALFTRLGLKQGQGVIDAIEDIDLADLDLQLACLDLGKIENIVDHCQQRPAGAGNGAGMTLGTGRQAFSRQQFGHDHDAIHRRANLVAHGGEEIGLGGVGGLGFVARFHIVGRAVLDLLLQPQQMRFQLPVAHPDSIDHGVETSHQCAHLITAFRLDAAGEIALLRDRLDGTGQLGQGLDHRLLQAARDPQCQPQGNRRQGKNTRQRLQQGAGEIFGFMHHDHLPDLVALIHDRRMYLYGAGGDQRHYIGVTTFGIERDVAFQARTRPHLGQRRTVVRLDAGIGDTGGAGYGAQRGIGAAAVTGGNGILGAGGQHIGGSLHHRPAGFRLACGFAHHE